MKTINNQMILKRLLFVISIGACLHLFGQDWNTIKTFTPAQTIQDVIPLNETTWIVSSSLYSGTGLNMKRSIDNGETWVEEYSGYTSQSFRSIASPDGETSFAIANSAVLITDNGTGTWETVDVPVDVHLRDIYFLNETDGWIGADAGVILKTEDGGETWAVSTTDTDEHIMAIDFNADRGIAVSHSGQVLYMDLPFVKLAEEAEITFNIYPNPCIDFLVIESMDWAERALFEIRDLSGRVIHHSVISNEPIDTRQLPDGTYMLYIYSGEKWLVKKFIKA